MDRLSITRHGADRINERLSLKIYEVRSIIESGLCLSLGSEPHCDRVNVLFYSEPDDDYFIAVIDEATSEVITVKSTQWYRRRIDPAAEFAVKQMILQGTPHPIFQTD
jgi:hypothetical protein